MWVLVVRESAASLAGDMSKSSYSLWTCSCCLQWDILHFHSWSCVNLNFCSEPKRVEPFWSSIVSSPCLPQCPGRRGFGDLASKRRQSRRELRVCVSRRPEHRHWRRLWISQTVRLPLHREVCESLTFLFLTDSFYMKSRFMCGHMKMTKTNIYIMKCSNKKIKKCFWLSHMKVTVEWLNELLMGFCFIYRPNTSATSATRLTWPTSASPTTTNMWSAQEETTAGKRITTVQL